MWALFVCEYGPPRATILPIEFLMFQVVSLGYASVTISTVTSVQLSVCGGGGGGGTDGG